MPSVVKTMLPASSRLHSRVADSDFLDCYRVTSSLSVRDAAGIALNFPNWASVLLKLRNVIVAPLGLSGSGPADKQSIGIFPIDSESESELIVGFNDKHLNFRVAILSEAGAIYMATWVHPHNVGGHIYLAMVMPFHILIVRNALHRVSREGAV